MKRKMRKSLWPLVVAVAGVAFVFAQIALPAAAQHSNGRRKPNIILILADDLGYGDLGSYGQKSIKTPQLDRLAREGTRFTQFYAGCAVCAPSRASLMTGLHQGHAYVRGNTDVNNQRVSLRPQDVTVAEVLKRAGYRTGIIGKWGLGEPGTTGVPNRKGFDYWFGYLNQNHAHNYYPDYLWRNEERVNVPKGTYSHDLFTQEALDFVRREHDHPFFLYLAYTIPHANNELHRQTGNGMEVPSAAPYEHEDWPAPAKNYAAMITRMDTDVGKLLALLDELRLTDDTVVMFTSDNGPQGPDEGGYDPSFFDSNGPFRGIKRDLYEGGIREPLIVRWPRKVAAGRVSDHVWAQWDFLPTAAAIAGDEPPAGLDGLSMLPVLLGGQQPQHEYLYWEFHEGGYAQALRLGRWKAVRRGNNPIELYDLQTDIKEAHDLASAQPALVRRADEIMRREHVESEHWPVRPPPTARLTQPSLLPVTFNPTAGQAQANRTSYKFDFGPGKVASGYTQVLSNTIYSKELGYGFEPGFAVSCVDRGGKDALRSDFCTGDKPFYFSVALPEGNYNVTVTLGDAAGESTTTVKAELRRLMLEEVRTAKGQFATRTFTVNVRTPQIAGGGEVKLKERERTTELWDWDEKLTLEFNNTRPAVCALEITRADNVPTLFLLGDSTVTDQPREPYNSWGQMLPRFFKPGIAVANHAESGESLRSSLGARRLDKVLSLMKPGDYLFIQYGHNDEKEKGEGVGAFTTYKASLKHFVEEARKRGGMVVLVTPMHRRTFDAQGHITNSHGDYPEAVRQVAREEHVPLIDLNAMSKLFYEALGPEQSGAAFKSGDATHHSNYGSYELAKCIVEGIKANKLGLVKYLAQDVQPFDPSRPDPVASFKIPASPLSTDVKPLGN